MGISGGNFMCFAIFMCFARGSNNNAHDHAGGRWGGLSGVSGACYRVYCRPFRSGWKVSDCPMGHLVDGTSNELEWWGATSVQNGVLRTKVFVFDVQGAGCVTPPVPH